MLLPCEGGHVLNGGEIWDRKSRDSEKRGIVLDIDIVMPSSLSMTITYYSVMTDTDECD